MKNEAEIASWNGVIGDRWVDFQESMDERIRPFGAAAIERAQLRTGMSVLDVGCGCGDLSLDAAKRVGPAGRVVGLDVSKPMLARAAQRAADLSNVEFVEHDAATIAVREPFDALISRFGVMFFDDPVAAFKNLHAALKDAGIVAFACWQPLEKNAWAAVPRSAMLRVLPPPPTPTPGAPGPFAFADPAHVKGILAEAGFSEIAIEPFEHTIRLGKDLADAMTFVTKMGPSARLLLEAEPDVYPRAKEAIRETLTTLGPSFELGGAVWLVTASA